MAGKGIGCGFDEKREQNSRHELSFFNLVYWSSSGAVPSANVLRSTPEWMDVLFIWATRADMLLHSSHTKFVDIREHEQSNDGS